MPVYRVTQRILVTDHADPNHVITEASDPELWRGDHQPDRAEIGAAVRDLGYLGTDGIVNAKPVGEEGEVEVSPFLDIEPTPDLRVQRAFKLGSKVAWLTVSRHRISADVMEHEASS